MNYCKPKQITIHECTAIPEQEPDCVYKCMSMRTGLCGFVSYIDADDGDRKVCTNTAARITPTPDNPRLTPARGEEDEG